MIKVNKDFNNPPQELLNCAEKNKEYLLEAKEAKPYCYKKSKIELEKLYHKKCAYCETKYTEFVRIEHYRPKSVYYWLAYEWSNLLPTCEKCNNAKGNKFPIMKKQTIDVKKSDLKKLNEAEKPYLVNPEIDNPEEYFYFNEKTGEIKSKNERAEVTINTCQLNRTDFIIARQKQYNETKKNIGILYISKKNKTKDEINYILKSVLNKSKPENEYSAFHNQIWNNFEEIIVPHFKDKKLKDFVLTEYKLLKKKINKSK